jgi:hypothetical protein
VFLVVGGKTFRIGREVSNGRVNWRIGHASSQNC